LQGILQGIFAKMPLWGDFRAKFSLRFQSLTRQIPYSAEQGIFRGQQGIFRAVQGTKRTAPETRLDAFAASSVT
jgi:hypothetical protein